MRKVVWTCDRSCPGQSQKIARRCILWYPQTVPGGTQKWFQSGGAGALPGLVFMEVLIHYVPELVPKEGTVQRYQVDPQRSLYRQFIS